MKSLFLLLIFLISFKSTANNPVIAVATNFNHAMNSLVNVFESRYKIKIDISYGSTGSLYSQILNGAPFDAFFSADTKTVNLITNKGLALNSSKYIYALGSLAFICKACEGQMKWNEILDTHSGKISIANPKIAPYGYAAIESLEKVAIYSKVKDRIVYGTNVGQAFQYVESGNIPFGLVAYSLVIAGKLDQSQYQKVNNLLYSPIEQSAVILKRTKNMHAMKLFFNFLGSDEAFNLIKSYGYGVKEKSDAK